MGQSDKVSKFINMCTTLPFDEVQDERDENSIPELKHVAELRDSGNMQDAIDYGTTLMKMYPDNDLIPFMIGYIYYQKQFPREAMQIAVNAIPRCPRKYRLYSLAGLAEFELGHLPEALVWWSRSVIAQCKIADFQEHDPFLHLAVAAQLVGEKRPSEALLAVTDAIVHNEKLRLDDESTAKLESVKRSWVADPLKKVLQEIEAKYMHG